VADGPGKGALPLSHPAALLATWFGSGLLPWAPGTWGSLAALPFGAGLAWAGGPWALLAGAVAVFVIGLWASERYATASGRADPGAVVIDEVAGQWLALIPCGLDPLLFAASFVAFRFFDIAKVWPANWLDRNLKGSFGIMADDIAAGFYAGLLCYGLTFWLG
jgi:phosphatidylglycerophosphatase A